jgi:hypothetical protein
MVCIGQGAEGKKHALRAANALGTSVTPAAAAVEHQASFTHACFGAFFKCWLHIPWLKS